MGGEAAAAVLGHARASGTVTSADFLRGLSLGRSRGDAAVLGNAAAALVAQGLGSDAGDFDLDAADDFARMTPTR